MFSLHEYDSKRVIRIQVSGKELRAGLWDVFGIFMFRIVTPSLMVGRRYAAPGSFNLAPSAGLHPRLKQIPPLRGWTTRLQLLAD